MVKFKQMLRPGLFGAGLLVLFISSCMPGGPRVLPNTGEDEVGLKPTAARPSVTASATVRPTLTPTVTAWPTLDPAKATSAAAAPTVTAWPTQPANSDPNLADFAGFEDVMQAAGAQIGKGIPIQQAFIPADGREYVVNNQSVQVFQFGSIRARGGISGLVTPQGEITGFPNAPWPGQPNIWASGNLLVLYVGEDQAMIDLLARALGMPLTSEVTRVSPGDRPAPLQTEPALTGTPEGTPGTPVAVETQAQLPPAAGRATQAARQHLALELGINTRDIQVQAAEAQQWPDACLGLARPGELCAAAVTPGWEVSLVVQGQVYIYHTDQSGQKVRQAAVSAAATSAPATPADLPATMAPVQGIPAPVSPPPSSLTQILSLLRLLGVDARLPEGGAAQPLAGLSVPGYQVLVNQNERLQAFIYPDAAQAQADADKISPDGGTIGDTPVRWEAPPHFYRQGNVIVLYVGENARLMEILAQALGAPFAGGD